KKNVVDPDSIIGAYGADTARWFMLSDTPPERDIEWTAGGVEGAHRFLQRVWRLVGEAAALGSAQDTQAPAGMGSDAEALRRIAHKTVAGVTTAIEKLRFNTAVAQVYELANALSSALQETKKQSGSDLKFAIREAAEILVQVA